jgi:hypothetical protein
VQAVIAQRRGGGTPEAGSTTSRCPPCLAEQRGACRGQRRVCLSCGTVSVEEGGAPSGRTLSEGVSSRPTGVTRPEAWPLEV